MPSAPQYNILLASPEESVWMKWLAAWPLANFLPPCISVPSFINCRWSHYLKKIVLQIKFWWHIQIAYFCLCKLKRQLLLLLIITSSALHTSSIPGHLALMAQHVSNMSKQGWRVQTLSWDTVQLHGGHSVGHTVNDTPGEDGKAVLS